MKTILDKHSPNRDIKIISEQTNHFSDAPLKKSKLKQQAREMERRLLSRTPVSYEKIYTRVLIEQAVTTTIKVIGVIKKIP